MKADLMLRLFTAVHPIPVDNPWNAPEGWRWVIQTDARWDRCEMRYDVPDADANCVIAGFQSSREDAESVLSTVVMACKRTALILTGEQGAVEQHVLADCPLDSGVVAELAVLG